MKLFTTATLLFISAISLFSQDQKFYIDDGDTFRLGTSPGLTEYANWFSDKAYTGQAKVKSAVSFTSSNLPIIVLQTNGVTIPDDPKVIVKMGIIDNGPGMTNAMTDKFVYYGNIGIEIRGSSSQMFPKKQYGFELRAADTQTDTTASLLGLPAESDWIISAPYTDKTFLRDALTYYLGRKTGHYAPRTAFCELVINGEYMGLFHLTEKIKRDKRRVNIKKLTTTANYGDSITGGYIIKFDKDATWSNGWKSLVPQQGKDVWMCPDYPKTEDITSAQFNYIKNFVGEFESALNGSNFADSIVGYRKYIYVRSFIDYFIIQELSRNVDGYRISTFFFKDRDSNDKLLHAGPLWDFNLGYGNADYCDGGLETGWAYNFNNVCGYDSWQVPFWWPKLLTDPYFKKNLYSRWTQLRTNELKYDSITSFIDQSVALINDAQKRNFVRWPDVLGQYVWPNRYVFNTYEEEIAYLKQWIYDRLNWMDASITNTVSGVSAITYNPAILSVVPNPVVDKASIDLWLPHPAKGQIVITDVLGKKEVIVATGNFLEGKNQLELNPRLLSKGMNIVSFYATDGSVKINQKVVRQ